jgi:hypothetical protein
MFLSNQQQPILHGIPAADVSMSSSLSQQQQQQQSNENLTNSSSSLDIATFYIVQKCWYSGPKVPPTVDYLRLLPSIGEAEQVAYQSAHTYASVSTQGNSSNSTGRNSSSVVRTIQIPIHHNKDTMTTQAASSYGFVANGMLFWIRRIRVWISTGVPINTVVDSAHCILSNGVIGLPGTSTRLRATAMMNSTNRTADTEEPCAYVGPAGYAWALQQSASGRIQLGSTIQWIPVGKPNFENITGEWPDRAEWSISTTTVHNGTVSQVTKRVSDHSKSDHYWFSSTTSACAAASTSCSSSSDVSDLDESHRGLCNNRTDRQDDVAMDTTNENDGSDDDVNHRMALAPPASKRRCPEDRHHRDILSTTTTTSCGGRW